VIPTNNHLTVGEYFDQWLARRKGQIEYESWRRNEESFRNHIKPALGRIALTKLTKQHVRQLYADVAAKGLKRNTVAKVQITLRKALNDAIDDDLLVVNVAARISLPPDKRGPQRTFKAEETNRMIEAAEGNRYKALIALLATTGCRLGEALGLRWQALDLDRGTMRVETVLKELDKNVWGWVRPRRSNHAARSC
jgi:integrase